MIISVEELKERITTDKPDSVLEDMLAGIETAIRNHTNNNFQHRGFRTVGTIEDGKLYLDAAMFKAGDTIQISESDYNAGLYVVPESEEMDVIPLPGAMDETDVLVTKVVYPADVRIGAVNLLKWDLENREKVGIQSETISRHSVTYFNMDGDNSVMGYPKSMLGFLKPYHKARF
jgi:hypothetical protein